MTHRLLSVLASRKALTILTFVPFAFAIIFIATHAVNVPYIDQWEFVPLLEKSIQGNLTFHDLWVQHNEHRILFPKLIMFALARMTHWDIRYEIGATCFFVTGVMLLIVWQVDRTSKTISIRSLLRVIPICSLIVFSFSQYENFLWGWQLTLFLNLFTILAAAVLLGNPPFTWTKFTAAMLLTLIGTYSFANGMLFWPIGAVLVWCLAPGKKERFIASFIWSLTAALSIGTYLWRYTSPPEHPSPLTVFKKPWGFVRYFFMYCGNLCAHVGQDGFVSETTWGFIFGLAAVSLWVWASWRIWRGSAANLKVFAPYFAMSAYSLGSALMTAVGRSGFGATQSISSRYCTLTIPFWVPLVIFLAVIFQAESTRPPRPAQAPLNTGNRLIAQWSLVMLIGLFALSSFFSIRPAQQMALSLDTARAYLQTLSPNPNAPFNEGQLLRVSLSPGMVAARARVLMLYHLSMYNQSPFQTSVEAPTGTPPLNPKPPT